MEFLKKIFTNPFFISFLAIILSLLIILILLRLSKYLFLRKSKKLFLVKGIKDAREYKKFNLVEKLDESTIGLELTFSGWFYIKDLDYRYSKPKHLFHVGDADARNVTPGIWLHPKNNDLLIRIHTHNRDNTSLNPEINLKVDKNCNIENIKVQRWNHLAVVLQNKTLDVYINGQLRRSCTLYK